MALQRSWGEYREVTYPYSPDCLLNRSSFRSFGYASLVRTLPSLSRKGAALDPPGGLVPLDSHARIRSLIALRFFFFFIFLSTPHFPLNSHSVGYRLFEYSGIFVRLGGLITAVGIAVYILIGGGGIGLHQPFAGFAGGFFI